MKFVWFSVAYLMHMVLSDAVGASSRETETCTISLIVPPEYVKSSCEDGQKTNNKIQSVEIPLSKTQDLYKFTLKMPQNLSQKYDGETEQLLQAMDNHEIIPFLSQQSKSMQSEYLDNDISHRVRTRLPRATRQLQRPPGYVTKKRLVRVMKPLIHKQLLELKAGLRDEIKKDLLKEMTLLMKTAATSAAPKDIAHLQAKHDIVQPEIAKIRPKYAPSRQNNFRRNSNFQSDRHSFGKRLDRISAQIQHASKDNENDLPPGRYTTSPRLQADSQAVQDDADFLSFKKEVRTYMHEHSEKLKRVEDNQNEDELKLKKLMGIMEELVKNKPPSKEYTVPELSMKVQELQENIESITTSIRSLREHFFSDPLINRQLIDMKTEMENQIKESISKDNDILELKVVAIQAQLEGGMKNHRKIQKEIQNFLARMRVQVHGVEQEIARAMDHIQTINATLNPYMNESMMEDAPEISQINETVHFVKQIKKIWPSLVQNINNNDTIHPGDTGAMKSNLVSIETRVDQFHSNQSVLTKKIHSVKKDIDTIQKSLSTIEDKHLNCEIQQGRWVKLKFNSTTGKSACVGGDKYVKRTRYNIGMYVGVELCSPTRYKIYLSDSLGDDFLNIGAIGQSGEDHCEFVGAHRHRNIRVGRLTHGNHRERTKYMHSTLGRRQKSLNLSYKRKHWGEVPVKGSLNFFNPTPTWYECGIAIPG